MGRPLKPIDAEMVRKLAKIGCTQRDIAEFFGVAHSVISERFRTDFQLGSAQSKISLRRAQFKRALQGSDTMLIHLGRSVLSQGYQADKEPKPESMKRIHLPRRGTTDTSRPNGDSVEGSGHGE